ncbi:MAG: dicarboxylate/amino acid:cation symporter [Verrucomicrobia bacterium]|nr:dicarboxylate/amino acid:cation symporter [Verrucomicrobiota bacterium]
MLKAIVSFFRQFDEVYKRLTDILENFMPALNVASFIAGIFLAKFSAGFSEAIDKSVSSFIGAYGFIAPFAIFFIFAPSLSKLLSMGKAGKFSVYVIGWLGLRRFMACVWGAVFTAMIFRFPLLPTHSDNLASAVMHSLKSFVWMATHSSYFFAIYMGVAISFIALKTRWLKMILNNCLSSIEYAGQYFELLVPVFMLAVGGYIYNLPQSIEDQLKLKEFALNIGRVDFLGLKINPHTPADFIWIYVIGAFLVGIACFIWHSFLIGWVKFNMRNFCIRTYFTKYWIKVYPLLWATSSESLATPLNLHLTKVHYPQIKDEVRSFVVGMGSYLNINGTLICVFVLLGVVVNIIGIRLSLLELLFCVPIVFLIGYGVPGIPGELILFAGPIALLLNLPQAVMPAYLALYCGLQLGLPDSFRTGNNSTDNVLCALLLNDIYEKKFLKRG